MKTQVGLIWIVGAFAVFAEVPPLPEWNHPGAEPHGVEAKGADPKAADPKAAEILPAPAVLPGEGEGIEGVEPPDLAPADRELDGDLVVPILVPESTLDAYFAARPAAFLVDPQDFLVGSTRESTARLLDYHAEESVIDLYVYIFGKDQEIPTAVRTEELMEASFSSGRPAVVVFYYLGMPERSEILLAPPVSDAVPVYEQRRSLQNSIQMAVQQQAPIEQLHAFINQMSIRIYWMERLPGINGGKDKAGTATPPVPVKPASAAKAAWKENLRAMAVEFGPRVGIGAAVLIGAMLLWARWRSRLRYLLPEIEVEPRLGGPHAAGVGAVISFASAGTSPTTQRIQFPGYLRRR